MGKKKSNASPHRLRIRAEKRAERHEKEFQRRYEESNRKSMYSHLPIVLAWILILGLLAMISISWKDIWGSYFVKPEDYATTSGTVKSVIVWDYNGPKGTYRFDIEYDHRLNGHSYTGNRVSYEQTTGHEKEMYSYLREYPLGGAVTVHYAKPDSSYTALKPLGQKLEILETAAVFVGMAILLAGVGLYNRNRWREELGIGARG